MFTILCNYFFIKISIATEFLYCCMIYQDFLAQQEKVIYFAPDYCFQ